MLVIDLNAPTSMQSDSNLSGNGQIVQEDDDNEVIQLTGEDNQVLEEDTHNLIVLTLPAILDEPVNFGHLELQPEDLNALDSTANQEMSNAIVLYDPVIIALLPLQSKVPSQDQKNDNEIQIAQVVNSPQLDQNLQNEAQENLHVGMVLLLDSLDFDPGLESFMDQARTEK
jgi:hypothetical protein